MVIRIVPTVTQEELLQLMFGPPAILFVIAFSRFYGRDTWPVMKRFKFQVHLQQLIVYNFAAGIATGMQFGFFKLLANGELPGGISACMALTPIWSMPYLPVAVALAWLLVGHIGALSFVIDGKLAKPTWVASVVCIAGSMLYELVVVALSMTRFHG